MGSPPVTCTCVTSKQRITVCLRMDVFFYVNRNSISYDVQDFVARIADLLTSEQGKLLILLNIL